MIRSVPIEVLPLLFAATVLFVFLLYAWGQYLDGSSDNRVVLFVLLAGTSSAWALTEAIHLMSPGTGTAASWEVISTMVGSGSAVLWLLFMLAYTDRSQYVTLRWAALYSVPLVALAVLFAVAPDRILLSSETITYRGVQFVEATLSPLAQALLLYFSVIALIGSALAVETVVRRRYRDRRQGVALALVGILPTLASGFELAGITPHPAMNVVPITYALTAPLLGYAVFRYDLLNPTETVHEVAFETMPEVVLVVDDDGRIVGLNPAGEDLFGVDDVIGEPAEATLDDYPTLVDHLSEPSEVDTDLSFSVDGTKRHFSMLVRPVDFRNRPAGTLLLLEDVTALKAREEDLELLKRIQSRVLRHNIRNDSQVARGFAELIASEHDGETEQRATKIMEKLEELSETTEKARQLASIVDASGSRRELDLCQLVANVRHRTERTYPRTTVRTDLPDEASVLAHNDLEVALWNLVENAIVHQETTAPLVEVTAVQDGDRVTVTVEDDGPGIPDHELSVLDERLENALEHGSGAGLWLVDWIVELSGGTLTFESSDDGTTARIELEVPREVDRGFERPISERPAPETTTLPGST